MHNLHVPAMTMTCTSEEGSAFARTSAILGTCAVSLELHGSSDDWSSRLRTVTGGSTGGGVGGTGCGTGCGTLVVMGVTWIWGIGGEGKTLSRGEGKPVLEALGLELHVYGKPGVFGAEPDNSHGLKVSDVERRG